MRNSQRLNSLLCGSRRLAMPPPMSISCGFQPSQARHSSPTRRAKRIICPSQNQRLGWWRPAWKWRPTSSTLGMAKTLRPISTRYSGGMPDLYTW